MEKLSTLVNGKIKIEVNQNKLADLIALSKEPTSPDIAKEIVNKAQELAREAFGGYDVGTKGHNARFALYDGVECVGSDEPNTEWYNPNIDWSSVKQAVKAIWEIERKSNK